MASLPWGREKPSQLAGHLLISGAGYFPASLSNA
jgi:hypothetical protein